MKFRFNFLLPVILLLFSVFAPKAETKAQETDYVAAAVAALQTSNIYVHPGTPGTDFDTANELSAYMPGDSQVVLVILPFDALTGSNIESLARDISVGLNNQKTIGLAIGPNLVGYSTVLPEGLAASMMARASSVSNSPITALIAFSQSVQLWYDSNPQPTPTPTPEPTPTPRPTMQPIDVPETSEVPSSVWVIFIFFFAIFTVFLATSIKKARDKQKLDSIMSQIDREDY